MEARERKASFLQGGRNRQPQGNVPWGTCGGPAETATYSHPQLRSHLLDSLSNCHTSLPLGRPCGWDLIPQTSAECGVRDGRAGGGKSGWGQPQFLPQAGWGGGCGGCGRKGLCWSLRPPQPSLRDRQDVLGPPQTCPEKVCLPVSGPLASWVSPRSPGCSESSLRPPPNVAGLCIPSNQSPRPGRPLSDLSVPWGIGPFASSRTRTTIGSGSCWQFQDHKVLDTHTHPGVPNSPIIEY